MVRFTVLLFVIATLLSQSIHAQEPECPPISLQSECRQEILDLITAMKLDKMVVELRKRMFETARKEYPTLPEAFWANAEKQIPVDSMINLMVTMWSKQVSRKTIRDLTEFYRSPLGQSASAAQVEIVLESMQPADGYRRALNQMADGAVRQQEIDAKYPPK